MKDNIKGILYLIFKIRSKLNAKNKRDTSTPAKLKDDFPFFKLLISLTK